MTDEEDCTQCEILIRNRLSIGQIRVINSGFPIWELNPPQREEYLTPEDYVFGLAEYANRVIQYRNDR